jgi:DDE superfamily endonuclease/Helix-turn-helix of DDE superfamily endonuclease
LRYETLTGLSCGQLHELTARILQRCGDVVRAGGRPAGIGLLGSVAMVVTLMRKNITQEAAGAIFGVSQSTVSRRWDLLRPLIGQVLAGLVPSPREIAGKGTLLVDGTVCPVWDWSAIPGLFSGKAGYAGMNVQIAATMAGNLAAVGPVPVPGARHDAYAFEASGLKDLIAGLDAAADLGYTGVDGVAIVPFRTPPGGTLHESQLRFNKDLSVIRAAVERAVAHLKTWRMLSEEGGRFRPPLSKFGSALTAIIGLFFFSNYYKPFE